MTDQTDTEATALAVKLLPCPFCSGPATAWETEGGEMCPSVWCRNSVSCGGQVCIEDASRDAIAAWNTRPPAAPATGEVVDALRAEIADLQQSVIALCAPWAVEYARSFGLARNELHPGHYDILAKCGARMDSFTRADLAAPRAQWG